MTIGKIWYKRAPIVLFNPGENGTFVPLLSSELSGWYTKSVPSIPCGISWFEYLAHCKIRLYFPDRISGL